MSPAKLVELARTAAKDWVALNPGKRLTDTALEESFHTNVPKRERDAGDKLIFRATFLANVERALAEKKMVGK